MGKCGKGTGSFGLRNGKSHKICLRCGKHSMHIQKKTCASCGYPNKKMRRFNWSEKALRRRTTGTGRTRHMRDVKRRFASGFKQSGAITA